MYRVGGGVAAALAVLLCVAPAARADDTSGLPPVVDRVLLSSGFDLWRNGGSLYGGLVWSPRGLAQEGFTLKLLLSGGLYRYHAGLVAERADYGLAAILPGWRLRAGTFELVAYAGLDLQQHRTRPLDPANALRGFHAGMRAGVDTWYEPAPGTMIASSLWGSSIGRSYWTRLALGWRLLDLAWVGPEIGAQGNSVYRQIRAGLHVTGFRTGPLEWAIGAGYATDTDHRSSPYLRLDLLTRQ
jgi:hypothetical protein